MITILNVYMPANQIMGVTAPPPLPPPPPPPPQPCRCASIPNKSW